MESTIASSFRHQKSASSHRFLGLFSGNAEPGPAVELDEHDVFWNDRGDFPDQRPQCSPEASANSMPSRGSGGITGFRRQENFGILAALPDTLANDHRSFLHRSVTSSPSYSSSPSPSSSRMIPTIPKPQPPDPGEKLHQSAPLNVPVRPMVAGGRRRNLGAFYEFDNGDEDGDDEMLPPHEIVARGLSRSPMTTFSVLEGKGRTLKGRDLRRVRNAVFQKTGCRNSKRKENHGKLMMKYDDPESSQLWNQRKCSCRSSLSSYFYEDYHIQIRNISQSAEKKHISNAPCDGRMIIEASWNWRTIPQLPYLHALGNSTESGSLE